ncbi:Cytochrome c-type biogenesis protein CcmC, putative heme lyase for CcmE [Bartonella ancashensis]|uniref:Heme exporter protein C n=2 Tax=Bartonella ancashensis TaxID=1318743 RepID=A0A0M5KZ74_9HYPH|nr:Cytochrome c-type biogenesis protein CcmC, putative heme lyase for CcmE [Bartonella ancashensis]
MKFVFTDVTYFMKISTALLPWLIGMTVLLLVLGITLVMKSPNDYQQGITVKIMYIHAPFAWLSTLCYVIMSIAAFITLIWSHNLASIVLKCGAPIGTTFTALALVTGALWGHPTWGTWWVWDARLTSVLILFFIYLAITMLSRAFINPAKAAYATSILTLVGLVNIPIIKFSVYWWHTLHQQASLIRPGGTTIDSTMLWPLITMAICFAHLFVVLYLMAMRNEITHRRIKILQTQAAHRTKPRILSSCMDSVTFPNND